MKYVLTRQRKMDVVEILSKIRIVNVFGLDCERLKICLIVFSIEFEPCSFDCLEKCDHSTSFCLIDRIKELSLFGTIVGIDYNRPLDILPGSEDRGNFNY